MPNWPASTSWPATGSWPAGNSWPSSGAPPLRQSARRCFVHTNVAGTPTDNYNVRIGNYFVEDTNTIQVGFPNWWNNNSEVACTGTLTVRAYFEYPLGTLTPLTFQNGLAMGTIATGDVNAVSLTLDTDLCAIPMTPALAPWWLTFYWQSTTGQLPFTVDSAGLPRNIAGGDAIRVGANVAQSGAFTDQGIGVGMWPAYIASRNSKRAYAIIGDSRNCSESAVVTADSTGNIGEVGRAIGTQAPYLNLARSGASTSLYIASHFQRQALLAKYTDAVIYDLGINNFQVGGSAAVAIADRLTIRGYNPSLPFYACTVPPKSSSLDGWITVINQTTDATANPPRVTYNTQTRTNSDGFSGVFDLCSTMESGLNSGLWAVGVLATPFTGDGLHGNTTGCSAAVIALPP